MLAPCLAFMRFGFCSHIETLYCTIPTIHPLTTHDTAFKKRSQTHSHRDARRETPPDRPNRLEACTDRMRRRRRCVRVYDGARTVTQGDRTCSTVPYWYSRTLACRFAKSKQKKGRRVIGEGERERKGTQKGVARFSCRLSRERGY